MPASVNPAQTEVAWLSWPSLLALLGCLVVGHILMVACSSAPKEQPTAAKKTIGVTDEQIFLGDTSDPIEKYYHPHVIMKRGEAFFDKEEYAEALVEYNHFRVHRIDSNSLRRGHRDFQAVHKFHQHYMIWGDKNPLDIRRHHNPPPIRNVCHPQRLYRQHRKSCIRFHWYMVLNMHSQSRHMLHFCCMVGCRKYKFRD